MEYSTNYNTSTPAAVAGLEQAKARISHLEARRAFWKGEAQANASKAAAYVGLSNEVYNLRAQVANAANSVYSVQALKSQLASAQAAVTDWSQRKAKWEKRARTCGYSASTPGGRNGGYDEQQDTIDQLRDTVDGLESDLSEIRATLRDLASE